MAKDAKNTKGASASAKRAVMKLGDDAVTAVKKADMNFFDRKLASDFRATVSNGETKSKLDLAIDMKSGYLAYSSIKVDESEMRIYGDTAVVTGYVTVKGKSKTKSFSGRERVIAVLTRQNGDWQAVEIQSTKVEKK